MHCFLHTDYYPFGMLMPNRHGQDDDYRYGWNGAEKDDEVRGTKGASYDLGARMYDPRIGRMLSSDPWEDKYPWQSSYAYFKNSPILTIDWKGFGGGPDWWENILKGWDIIYGKPMRMEKKRQARQARNYRSAPRTGGPSKNITGNYFGDMLYNLFGGPTMSRAYNGDVRSQGQVIMGGISSLSPASRTGTGMRSRMLRQTAVTGKARSSLGSRMRQFGVRRTRKGKFNQANIDKIQKHFDGNIQQSNLESGNIVFEGGYAENNHMLDRLNKISNGEIKATNVDKNFLRHELYEKKLMDKGMSWDKAHRKTIKKFGQANVDLYTGGANKADGDQMDRYLSGKEKTINKN